jgi:predicted Rdx family selenoprotein
MIRYFALRETRFLRDLLHPHRDLGKTLRNRVSAII